MSWLSEWIKEPAWVAWGTRNALEGWGWFDNHSHEVAVSLMFVCAILLILLFSKHSKIAVATPFVTFWTWVGGLPGVRHVKAWWGERLMRKDRYAAQSNEWVEELLEVMESKAAAGFWTETECKEWCYAFSRHFPVLKYASFAAVGSGIAGIKAAIRERMLNLDRDINGNVVPAPLP